MTNPQVTLTDAIRDYITDCRTLRHLADSTVQRYEITLNHFARPLVEKEPYLRVVDIPPEAWRDYVLASDHLSNKSFNAYRSRISAFLTWLYAEGVLSPADKHLAHLREKPNTTARPKSFVTAEQVPAVLDAAEQWHIRDRYFCEALWHSWRRSGELCAVRVRDVDLKPYPDSPHGRLTWTNQKAHRPNQVLDMSPGLQRCLREWLAVYSELEGETPEAELVPVPGDQARGPDSGREAAAAGAGPAAAHRAA